MENTSQSRSHSPGCRGGHGTNYLSRRNTHCYTWNLLRGTIVQDQGFTFLQAWNIIKNDGLRPMDRKHIHFAIGQYGSAVVISGMRKSAQVLIYLDVEAVLRDGIPLQLSANKVVLSPGDENGKIAPKYFKYVLNTKLEPFDPDFPVKAHPEPR